MNISVIKRRDTFIGISAFRLEYPEDFPVISDQAEQMDEIDTVLGLIEQHSGDQALSSGNARFNFNNKDISREKLREIMNDISTIAGTLAYKIAGIDLLFHIPRNLTDAAMLALARSFAVQAVTYQDKFVRRGLKLEFIDELQAATDTFEESMPPPEMAQDARVEATAALGEAVRRGTIARNILKGILKIKYKNDPAKMKAWLSASHIQRET